MRIYVVSVASIYEDPYEGRCSTYLDSVWSSLDKARERINNLKEKKVRELSHPEECLKCSEPCDDRHYCFYSNIDDADPNHIRLYECASWHTDFFMQERRLDIVDDEAK